MYRGRRLVAPLHVGRAELPPQVLSGQDGLVQRRVLLVDASGQRLPEARAGGEGPGGGVRGTGPRTSDCVCGAWAGTRAARLDDRLVMRTREEGDGEAGRRGGGAAGGRLHHAVDGGAPPAVGPHLSAGAAHSSCGLAARRGSVCAGGVCVVRECVVSVECVCGAGERVVRECVCTVECLWWWSVCVVVESVCRASYKSPMLTTKQPRTGWRACQCPERSLTCGRGVDRSEERAACGVRGLGSV